jgi:pilus assembly protein CpaF
MGLKERIAAGHVEPVADADEVTIDQVSVSFIRRKLVEEVDLGELSQLSPSQRRARLERTVGRILSSEGPVLSTNQRSALIRQIVDESIGLGVLEPLLADESVTEIMVNGFDEVWVERAGVGLVRTGTRFRDNVQLLQTIDRIVSTVNRRVDESSPMVDARLPGGERVNVIIPPLALGGPTLTIRRFPRLYTLDEIVEHGSLDPAMADLLRAFVRARLNIIVSGGTGAGKTTLLNALSASIPGSERIITIEDSAELKLQQPHVVSLEGRPANVEGRGAVSIRDLVRNSLRMRPDRIVVGEVRGAETLDMLQAMNTGHEGSLSTVHANSAEDAVSRLETLASMSDVKIPYEALRDQINSAIDIVVQLERGMGDVRRVVEIATISSRRREAFLIQSVAAFEPDPMGPGGTVTGTFTHFPLTPRVSRRLALRGEKPPPEFTVAADAAEAPRRAVD